jgi:hypothetical protein
MADKCARCQKSVFPAEKPIKIVGATFHEACFRCELLKFCGLILCHLSPIPDGVFGFCCSLGERVFSTFL